MSCYRWLGDSTCRLVDKETREKEIGAGEGWEFMSGNLLGQDPAGSVNPAPRLSKCSPSRVDLVGKVTNTRDSSSQPLPRGIHGTHVSSPTDTQSSTSQDTFDQHNILHHKHVFIKHTRKYG